MKKLLLIAATLGIAVSSNAQKLALYEEFTGENCPPCASTNPVFDALAITAANASKVLVIKYQVPIPSAGTILYPQAKVYADARDAYYTVTSAPSGKLDGVTPTTGGHPINMTQAVIDAAAAMSSPFNITVTTAWDATYSNILATINVTATGAYSGSGSVYLRTALVQDVDYCTPPGTNGETHFSHVVRSMYPDATGTSIASTWAVGTTQTYNFTIPVPNYVDKSSSPFIAVWIQSDGDKKIAQAARSTSLPKLATDLAHACPVSSKVCITGASGSVTHDVKLENKGTTSVSNADIYYKVGTGAYAKYTWSGTVAAGATTTVTMPGVTLNAGASYTITDSIDLSADKNRGNNVTTTSVAVLNTIPKALPLSYDFEADYPLGYLNYDFDKKGGAWIRVYSTSGALGHSGAYAVYFPLYGFADGTTSYFVVPTPTMATKTKIEFWEAYAQINAADNDKLEVVYSTNCGASWNTLWSATGAGHATRAPKSDNVYVPASPSEYVKRSIDISSMPANALLALRATAFGGNTIFVDDINILAGAGIEENNSVVSKLTVSPNPAKDFTVLTFNLNESASVSLHVVDALGRTILSQNNGIMNAGIQDVKINTSNLAAGLYVVKISTDNGTITERISVVK